MEHTEGYFRGVGGLSLYHQCWRPEESKPKAVVVLVHGVGEYSGRYTNVVEPLVKGGYAVYSYDHRGHGASEGRRVHITRWAEYREDLGTYLDFVNEQAPACPVVLYGHSMGSLVVLDYLLEERPALSGAIISGVATQPVGVGGPVKIAMAKVLSGVLPTLSVDLGINGDSLTSDPAALEIFEADPKLTSRATVRWGAESLKTVDRIKQDMSSIDLPILVVHGGDDPLNSPVGAEELIEAASHPDKTLLIYPGVRHEPHNDRGHERLAADLAAWLDCHC